jgi:putative membrane protein
MSIAMSKTREQFPLSFKKIIKKTLAGTLVWVILLFFVWIFIISSLGLKGIAAIMIVFGLMILIVLITYFYQKWYFNVYFYDLTSDFIIIKKGPITPREITIPYERVQDVYVDQDILDRIFGLYDVHLSSATISSGMEAHIDGVEKPAADGLRQKLLQTVQQKIGKKQNQNLNSNNPIS